MDSELRLGQGEMVRPPFFEGVNLTPPVPQQQQPPMQQPQQDVMASPQRPPQPSLPTMSPQPSPMPPQPQLSMALTTSDPYTMTPAEQSRYASLFPSYAQEGYIHGAAAVELFSKSGLDRGHLKEIWTMCDVPVDNKLDLMEFCVAMHLIVCVTKKGMAVPEGLPGSLRGLLEKRDGMNGQQQQQGQMGPMMGGQISPCISRRYSITRQDGNV